MPQSPVRELRLALIVADYDASASPAYGGWPSGRRAVTTL
jgi:hypothetical protein